MLFKIRPVIWLSIASLVIAGCAHKKQPIPAETKLMSVTALSDLVESFDVSESARNQDRYWYLVDANPQWVTPYFTALLEKRGLNVAVGVYEELRVAQSGKLFVPLDYVFGFNGDEWIATLNVEYPDSEVRYSRAYSSKRPITNTLRLVREKDTMWRTPVVK